MSDTPRTDAVNQYLRTRDDYTKTDHEVWMNHGCDIERELTAANERIKRLEEAGDGMRIWITVIRGYLPECTNNWRKAKEAK